MNQAKSTKVCTINRLTTALAVGALLLWVATPASAQSPPGCFGTGVSIILTPSNLPNLQHGDTIEYEIRLQVNAPACNMVNTAVTFFPPNIPPDAPNACNASNGILVATIPSIEQGGAQILITSPTNPNAGSADFTDPSLAYVVNHADEDANGVVTAFVCANGTQLTEPSQNTTAATSIPNAVSHACCLPDGSCVNLPGPDCLAAGGIAQPDGACTAVEACCLPDGTCADMDPLCCALAGGTPEGPGTVCTAAEACCLPDGTCVELDPLCCEDLGGVSGGPGSVCTAEEACCLPDNTCIVTDPVCCTLAGGTPEGPGTLCTEIQACCLPDGSCADMDPLCCEDLGGVPQGAGVLCASNPCEEGGEGCTPGYWKQPQHFGSWTPPYTPDTQFSAVFEDAFPGKTLLQVLSTGGGGLNALGRHTVAALLNAASADVDYGMTAQQVIDAFNAVYPGTKADYEALKNELAGLNERECPLGRAPLNGD